MGSGKQAKRKRHNSQGPSTSASSAKVGSPASAPSRRPLLIGSLILAAIAAIGGLVLLNTVTSGASPAGAVSENGGIVLTPSGPAPSATTSSPSTSATTGAATTHASATSSAVTSSSASQKPPTLDIYQDYACTHCADDHLKYGEAIKQWARQGTFQVVYHLKSNLGGASLRAGNAAACAADQGQFETMNNLLMQRQNILVKDGMQVDTLVRLGREAGIPEAGRERYESCVRKNVYEGYLNRVQQTSDEAGHKATPTVVAAGKVVDRANLTGVQDFMGRVLKAAGITPAPTPASTPTSTPSKSAP